MLTTWVPQAIPCGKPPTPRAARHAIPRIPGDRRPDPGLNIRVQRGLIDQAACREVADVLRDQRVFVLDAAAFATFQAVLDAPPADHPRLRALLVYLL
jgi:Protein of unknown function (DUF1778)